MGRRGVDWVCLAQQQAESPRWRLGGVTKAPLRLCPWGTPGSLRAGSCCPTCGGWAVRSWSLGSPGTGKAPPAPGSGWGWGRGALSTGGHCSTTLGLLGSPLGPERSVHFLERLVSLEGDRARPGWRASPVRPERPAVGSLFLSLSPPRLHSCGHTQTHMFPLTHTHPYSCS